MRSIFYEAKKHLSFRETWVGYILAVGFLIISVKNTVYTIPDVAEQWNNIFQDIYTYGATLSAFLVAIGISRLMCYEHEKKTDTNTGNHLHRKFTHLMLNHVAQNGIIIYIY